MSVKRHNALVYAIKKPLHGGAPRQIRLEGSWSLDKDRDVVFTLDRHAGSKTVLKGKLVKADAHHVYFSLAAHDKEGRASLYMLRLQGTWKADKDSRLIFYVQREGDTRDELIFGASWEINKNNQIVYRYTTSAGSAKRKMTKMLTLEGYWDLSSRHRISYILDARGRSRFDFSPVSGASVSIAGKTGLCYELGTRIAHSPRTKKTITLFGSFKPAEGASVFFEVPYGARVRRSVRFGATVTSRTRTTVALALKNTRGEPLGIEVSFVKRPSAGKEIFLHFERSAKERLAEIGARVKW